MRRNRNTAEEILDKHLPRVSDEHVASAGERVLYRLHHTSPRASIPSSGTAIEDLGIPRTAGGWWPILAGVAAVVAVALVLSFSGMFPAKRSPALAVGAVVESVDGTLHLDSGGSSRALRAGDVIPRGDSVRSGAPRGAVLALPDGSRIEMRADSELRVETANDGAGIRLRQGSVIVKAAKQRGGHLYVRTVDLSASVVGTVFMVSVDALSSRVGVIEGEVRVRDGHSAVSLLPGEQISSARFSKESIVTATFAWSTHASEYIALLTRTAGVAAPPPAQKPSFEVASIKRNLSGLANGGISPRGDRFLATNATLKTLLVYAYRPGNEQFLRDQVIGAPGWSDTDHFDIEAKLGADARSIPFSQMREMVISLLEKRFQLRAHRETRELPVYNLVLVKNGPKLSSDQTPPPQSQAFINFVSEGEALLPMPRGAVQMIESPVRTMLTGTAVPMSMVVTLLQGRSDRIILNKTDFNGLFDIDVQFAKDSGPVPPPETPIPTLFSAIGELGLKLESGKAALPVVIVDSVRPPSAN